MLAVVSVYITIAPSLYDRFFFLAFSNSDRVIRFRIPVPLQIGEIVRQGSWKFTTDSRFRIAGLDDIEEDVARYLDIDLS